MIRPRGNKSPGQGGEDDPRENPGPPVPAPTTYSRAVSSSTLLPHLRTLFPTAVKGSRPRRSLKPSLVGFPERPRFDSGQTVNDAGRTTKPYMYERRRDFLDLIPGKASYCRGRSFRPGRWSELPRGPPPPRAAGRSSGDPRPNDGRTGIRRQTATANHSCGFPETRFVGSTGGENKRKAARQLPGKSATTPSPDGPVFVTETTVDPG